MYTYTYAHLKTPLLQTHMRSLSHTHTQTWYPVDPLPVSLLSPSLSLLKFTPHIPQQRISNKTLFIVVLFHSRRLHVCTCRYRYMIIFLQSLVMMYIHVVYVRVYFRGGGARGCFCPPLGYVCPPQELAFPSF